MSSWKNALAIDSNLADVHNNLGIALKTLGQHKEAIASWRRALEIRPDFAVVHHNLGNALQSVGHHEAALSSYRRALEITPGLAETQNNLGTSLYAIGDIEEAEDSFRRALAIAPEFAAAHCNLGLSLQALGQVDEALAECRRALAINPDDDVAYTNLLFCLNQSEAVDVQELFAEHCRFGEQFEAPLRASWPKHINSRDPERCLQIGFVSGDLRKHPVATYFEPVLSHLGGCRQLELHAYSNSVVEDSVTEQLKGNLKHWHPIAGYSHSALAEKIRADGIDILIDISGHTALNRLLTFARKPAPVQATWIGYPSTTGLHAMDYYLSDRFLLPLERFDDQFTEKIVYLPAFTSFLPNQDAPPVNALPALSNGYLTFGSFNRPSKLSRSVIALWSQLLRRLPDSRVLLGGMPDDKTSDRLIAWFAQEGIVRERLSFSLRCSMSAYLGLHHAVDICLDSFPYTGGATTFHALWMGVPTLTFAGSTVPGRSGAGILGHLGLDGFVADDPAAFVEKGLKNAQEVATLASLRLHLRERFAQSALGHPELVAAGLERALRTMWQRWCAGQPIESF